MSAKANLIKNELTNYFIDIDGIKAERKKVHDTYNEAIRELTIRENRISKRLWSVI